MKYRYTLITHIFNIFYTFSSCQNHEKKININESIKYYIDGENLIKEAYNTNNCALSKQFFNTDTVPDGASIEYYDNYNISKWKWFTLDNKYPICCAYYNDYGQFDSFKGRTFIECIRKDKNRNSYYIKMAKIPNVRSVIILEDSSNSSSKKLKYDQIVKGLFNWIIIGEWGEIKREHTYIAYCYIIDSTKHELHLVEKTMHFRGDGEYRYENIHSKTLPINSFENQ